MIDKISQKAEQFQVPAGYAVTGTLSSTPLWLQPVSNWLEFVILIIGVIVGITTVWLNIIKIERARGK